MLRNRFFSNNQEKINIDAVSSDVLRLRGISMTVIVLVWSILVLLGWWFDLSILKNPFTDPVPVAPLTAYAFICASASLFCSAITKARWLDYASRAFAVVVHLIGLLVLIEFIHPRSELEPPAGRMALATSINFTMLGISLLFCKTKKHSGLRSLSHIFLVLIVCTSLFTLTGYSYDLLGAEQTLPMAMPTAILFGLIVLSVFCIHPYNDYFLLFQSDSAAGRIIRQLLPIIILGPLCLGWARLLAQRAGYFDTSAGAGLMSVSISATLGVFVFVFAKSLANSELEKKRQEESLKILAAIIESSDDAIISRVFAESCVLNN